MLVLYTSTMLVLSPPLATFHCLFCFANGLPEWIRDTISRRLEALCEELWLNARFTSIQKTYFPFVLNIFDLGLTLGRTRKLIPPPWYKGQLLQHLPWFYCGVTIFGKYFTFNRKPVK